MKTEREKFLAQLKKQMVHGTTASERLAATKMYGELLFGLTPADAKPTDGSVALPDSPVQPGRPLTEFEECSQMMMQLRKQGA